MKSKFIPYILAFISFVFISCPHKVPDWMLEQGQEITNFPEWSCNAFGFSPWMDWQGEDGKRLHDWVDGTVISDDFQGKFRMMIRGQKIAIGFNNPKGNFVELYSWYGEVHSLSDSGVSVEQDEPDNKFVYSCHLKKNAADEATEENRATVELTRIDEDTFKYSLDVAGKTVIDCSLRNVDFFSVCEDRYSRPTDIPVKLCDYFPIEYLMNEKVSFLYMASFDGSGSYRKIASPPGDLFRYIYCPEGYSFREINAEKNRISFNLLDAAESEYADYFEITVREKNDVLLSFYKIRDGSPVLLNTLSKPDLSCQWLLDSDTHARDYF